jgi:hypothetical protein
VVTKSDLGFDPDEVQVLLELTGTRFPVLPVSAEQGAGLDRLGALLMHGLQIVRVYTKIPGKPADREQPYTLFAGETVEDLARLIHRDLAASLRHARVWGSAKFDGQQVGATTCWPTGMSSRSMRDRHTAAGIEILPAAVFAQRLHGRRPGLGPAVPRQLDLTVVDVDQDLVEPLLRLGVDVLLVAAAELLAQELLHRHGQRLAVVRGAEAVALVRRHDVGHVLALLAQGDHDLVALDLGDARVVGAVHHQQRRP